MTPNTPQQDKVLGSEEEVLLAYLKEENAALKAEVNRLKLNQTSPVDRLAAIIREVDGNNDKGAAALAEAILNHPEVNSILPTAEGSIPTPEWIVNNLSELGVKVGNHFYFLYKGRSLEYGEEKKPMFWRPVFKREFGECCHPINYKQPHLVGAVSLTDSDNWQPLPLR